MFNKTVVRVPKWQIVFGTAVLCAFSYVCAWILFVNNVYAAIASLVLSPFMFVYTRKSLKKRFDRRVEKEFSDILLIISASLSSGMRLEQCIGEIASADNSEFGLLKPEFVRMNKLISLNRTAVKAFEELAGRFDSPDIKMFSLALSEGIPAGVNQVELVRSVSTALRLKNDTGREIERTLNLPKYNNRVITVMPFAVIFIVRKMSPEYLSCLESGPGRIIMIAASVLIGASVAAGYLIGEVEL